jgi:hypothetical protein
LIVLVLDVAVRMTRSLGHVSLSYA